MEPMDSSSSDEMTSTSPTPSTPEKPAREDCPAVVGERVPYVAPFQGALRVVVEALQVDLNPVCPGEVGEALKSLQQV